VAQTAVNGGSELLIFVPPAANRRDRVATRHRSAGCKPHDQGGGPTGARTVSSSASSIPGTESDGLSMNQSKDEQERSSYDCIGEQDRECLADAVSVEVDRVSQEQIGVAGRQEWAEIFPELR
jgi:hypothetical protein